MTEIMKPVQADQMLEENDHPRSHGPALSADLGVRVRLAGQGQAGRRRDRFGYRQTRSRARRSSAAIKQMLSRDLLFDVGADTVGLFVPGGSIAVKLAKAAIDTQRQ